MMAKWLKPTNYGLFVTTLRASRGYFLPISHRFSVLCGDGSCRSHLVGSLKELNDYDPKVMQKRFCGRPINTYDFARDRILFVLQLYDKIDPEKLTLDSHFFKDLGLDSLDHLDMIHEMEDEFQVEIPFQDAEKMYTPRDILDYIVRLDECYPELQEDEHH